MAIFDRKKVVQQRKASAEKRAVAQRNYRRARDRALARLSNLHPEDYKNLLEEEMVSDQTSGNAWSDLEGNSSSDFN